MTRQHRLHLIDLFAGCGGLSLGLEQAGFTPILFSEINPSAAATYLANRDGEQVTHIADVTSVKSQLRFLRSAWKRQGIQDIDLVCGGPPCQGYSGIGHRRTFRVERKDVPSNHLYKEMVEVIRLVRPRLFLFENVRGLKAGRWAREEKKGRIWEEVLGEFSGIPGYRVYHTEVLARDYGVPQNRPRLLIVGVRNDLGWEPQSDSIDAIEAGALPKGRLQPPSMVEAIGDLHDPAFGRLVGARGVLATRHYPHPPKSGFQREMRTHPDGRVLAKGAPLLEQEYSNHSPRIRDKFRYMLEHGGEIPSSLRTKKFAQRVLPRMWPPEGPNITVTSLPDDFVHYRQPRSLTVREYARLQTFPDWYEFRGPRTTGGRRRAGDPAKGQWTRDVPKYTQIGNAVPVRLARAIGEHFVRMLDRSSQRRHPRAPRS